MPEATVDENGQAGTGEGNVDAAPRKFGDAELYTEP